MLESSARSNPRFGQATRVTLHLVCFLHAHHTHLRGEANDVAEKLIHHRNVVVDKHVAIAELALHSKYVLCLRAHPVPSQLKITLHYAVCWQSKLKTLGVPKIHCYVVTRADEWKLYGVMVNHFTHTSRNIRSQPYKTEKKRVC